ncbi:phage baseplate assembly protein V [Halapricum salinum]|uniref:Phage tail protein n=1 Tax=Halapricum salinum TaxID=1457250 RepID=A0A4D6HDD8_9EURY|nr:phage baseplate assembly protein V [Halapricum salinum]QCC51226.1 phage tail protein [Halapricum salinum]
MSHPGFFDQDGGDRLSGVRVGVVTNNEDPKDLGRVKLRFPWRDADDESHWARLATPMAGSEYGAYFLPEVDDEVLVAFEDGDIHKPFVLGALWNGSQKPPQKNTEGNNDIRQIESRSGHTITFDDSEDTPNVEIETSAGHTIRLDDESGDEQISVEGKSGKNTITLDSSKGEISVVADKTLDLSAKNVKIDGSSEVSISTKSLDVSATSNAKISGGRNLKLKGQAAKLQGSGSVIIKGMPIKLN